MKTRLVLLGPPGVGKGTLAIRIKDELDVPHISTGDMFREAMKAKTPMGIKAESFISNGDLVPDEVVIGLVDERLSMDDVKKGFILDGFPRTNPQAEALSKILEGKNIPLDNTILLEADNDVIIQRLSGRRVCRECGTMYHVVNMPPKVEGVCDKCASTDIYQRSDDLEDAIKVRLETYEAQTAPLIEYYEKKNLIRRFVTNSGPDELVKAVMSYLG